MRTAIVTVVLVLWLVNSSYATKPCSPSPCMNEKYQINEALCREKSDWIAIGTLSNIVHDLQGMPTNKDFAKFTLIVKEWEKGGNGQGELKFKVGWCENQQELPKDTSGLFRFYGTYELAPVSQGMQYYYFEALKE